MKRKLLKRIGIGLLLTVMLLALAVVAFVFNPLEGSLRDVAGLVPRQVDFFLRKQRLAGDFQEFPEPKFWADFAATEAWQNLQPGPLVSGLRRDGIERSLLQARDAVQQLRRDSGGWLDLMRDLAGSELIVAGYFEDRATRKPLPAPRWCVYARVSWRLRAAWGLLQWQMVRRQLEGIDVQSDGRMLVIKPPGADTFYAARELDCLMLANDQQLLQQSLALAEGSHDEQPFSSSATYTDGVVDPLGKWAALHGIDQPNALQFSIAPNTTAWFQQRAARWPNAANPDNVYERVLASFLNLKGWNSISGALMFEPQRLSFLGEIVLNSNLLTQFQRNFFHTEAQERSKWLDKFLELVPDTACAAAALRMPAGEFIDTMFQALTKDDRELLNDAVRHAPWDGQQLADARELIDKLKPALLPRTGFVFRKNIPDPQIPVANPVPVPQVAWVFWVRDGGASVLQQLMKWMRYNAQSLRFQKVYLLKLNLSGGSSAVTEDTGKGDVVSEFTNPQIDGTGEIAALLFRDFFVLSNSGPLIKDMFWANYGVNGSRSIVENPEFQEFERELPTALNGLIYLRGPQLAELFGDFQKYADRSAERPDPEWRMNMAATAEEEVRRTRFPRYGSVKEVKDRAPEEFKQEVEQWLLQRWRAAKAGITGEELQELAQLRALSQSFRAAYVQLDLKENYMRFLGKVIASER